jgi:uncharacterized membrane protein (DUF373 family)
VFRALSAYLQRVSKEDEDYVPPLFRDVNRLAIIAMGWLNGFAHLVLGIALAISVLMFTWLFFADVYSALSQANLVHGFFHALGTLMLLWTISALISAEIRYMKGSPLSVDTFVEVTIVVVLRKLITMPVQEIQPTPTELILWVSAALLLGVMFLIVRYAMRANGEVMVSRRPGRSPE